MKILVCISSVPDTTSKIAFEENNTRFSKNGIQYIIGPYDDYALARGVELKEASGGSLTVLNVGLADAEPQIRKALAIGADEAVRIDAEPTDSFVVAAEIANYAQDKGFDLILLGRETTDYNSGVVHGIVGELLGIPSFSPVMELKIEEGKVLISREIEGGKEKLETKLPKAKEIAAKGNTKNYSEEEAAFMDDIRTKSDLRKQLIERFKDSNENHQHIIKYSFTI
jgi:electron transfer flavoprotein beta subunit